MRRDTFPSPVEPTDRYVTEEYKGEKLDAPAYTHVWYWRRQRVPGRAVDRKGQRCRVVARAIPRRDHVHSILVEFEDGARVVTSRYAVRKIA